MYCAKCGAQVDQGSSYCQKCGTAVDQPVVAQPAGATAPPMSGQVMANAKTSGMAIASLVVGIVSLIVNPIFILSILAIVFGVISMGRINRSGGAIKGKGLATAGLVLGIVAIVLTIFLIALGGVSFTSFGDFGTSF